MRFTQKIGIQKQGIHRAYGKAKIGNQGVFDRLIDDDSHALFKV